MKVLNGGELAGFIKERQAKEVRRLVQAHNIHPKLAIISTSDDDVTKLYLRIKQRYAGEIGVETELVRTTSERALAEIEHLNQDESVHGIIVQLPLDKPEMTEEVLEAVAPAKDVDGLAPGSRFDPPTPMAILWLLAGYDIDLPGKAVAIVGQGRLVGSPLRRMLESSGLEPMVFDEDSTDMTDKITEADIVISAAGVPGLITSKMLKNGAVLVDAGTAREGGAIKGDLADSARQRDDLILTPVKGGVGPLTVCALIDNVLRAARATMP